MASLTDNVFNKRGTWELFEEADGYDLSSASKGHIDRNGRLWLKIEQFLICTDGRHVLNAHSLAGIPESESIRNDDSGFSRADVFWAVTRDGRLHAVDLHTGNRSDHTENLPPLQDAYWLWSSAHEDIVIGIPEKVIRYDGNRASVYDVPTDADTQPHGKVHSATIAPDGTLWVVTPRGLHSFAGESVNFYENEIFGEESLWDVLVDGNGCVWMPIRDRVLIFDPAKMEVRAAKDSLQFHPVPSLIDDEGNLWANVHLFGAFCFNKSGFVTFPYEDTPAAIGPNQILQDRTRSFWFIGIKNGICRYNPWRINRLGRMRIEATARKTKGSIILSAASRGIYEYKDREVKQLASEAPFGCKCAAIKGEEELLLGTTRTGLASFDFGNGITTYAKDIKGMEPLQGRMVNSLTVAHDGDEWFSISHGLVRRDKTGLQVFKGEDLGISHRYVSLFTDSKGTIWIAGVTSDPLVQYRNGDFTTLSQKLGNGSGAVLCFFEDDRYIWMGTDKGSVLRCDRNTGDSELVMSLGHLTKIYDILIDQQGLKWIATDRGLLIADDKNSYFLQESSMLPNKNVIKTWPLNDKSVLIVTQYGACEYEYTTEHRPAVFISSIESDNFYARPKRVSLYEGHSRTTIRLGSYNMKTAPLKYQTRLVGHNDTWLDSWNEEIVYDRLPLGSYTFEARAVDQDLMTSEETARVEIEVIRDPRDKAILRLEGELKEAHDFAESIIKAIGEAIIVLNADARIVKTSDATLKLLGYDWYELLGKPVSMLFPEESAREFNADGVAKLAERRRHTGASESQLVKKNGEALPVLLSASRIYDSKGQITSFVMSASDLTSYKQLQHQVLQNQKLESLGVLAGGIAHDFNNMLAVIMGNAELSMASAPEDSPIRDFLSDILKASDQAAKLCSSMLAYAGKEQIFRVPLDLSQMVDNNASLLKSSISKKIDLQCILGEALPKVMGDEVQLTQMVMNFITNAAEAIGDDEGVICVRTSCGTFAQKDLASPYSDKTPPAGDYVVLEVSDTGCGMDSQTIRKIFEPFFTTKFTGRGLGLSAVHGIIRSHNASLIVKSKPGEGSTFKVYLPPIKDEQAAPETIQQVPQKPLVHPGAGTVLIADDEDALLVLASHIFKTLGYEVITAVDGAEALDKLKQNIDSICLVFLDITMPRMDGTEAYGHMRHIKEDLPIIICSGYSESDISSRFIKDEHLLFVHKPYRLEQVAEKVAQAFSDTAS